MPDQHKKVSGSNCLLLHHASQKKRQILPVSGPYMAICGFAIRYRLLYEFRLEEKGIPIHVTKTRMNWDFFKSCNFFNDNYLLTEENVKYSAIAWAIHTKDRSWRLLKFELLRVSNAFVKWNVELIQRLFRDKIPYFQFLLALRLFKCQFSLFQFPFFILIFQVTDFSKKDPQSDLRLWSRSWMMKKYGRGCFVHATWAGNMGCQVSKKEYKSMYLIRFLAENFLRQILSESF